MLYRLLCLLTLLTFTTALGAQACSYQLILQDLVSEDGWNGGQLTVRVGGVPQTYTLGSGRSETVFFNVQSGAAVELSYQRGAFPEETSFLILNNNDSLIYEVSAPPTTDDLFAFTAECVTCAPPPARSIELFRVRFNSVDVRLRRNPATEQPRYRIEYGLDDFDPEVDLDGEELITPDSLLRISGLESQQTYSFYVSTICAATQDTSERRGPFVITTQKEIDLGITLLQSPSTGCDINGQALTVGITNYGGAPQQFFRLGYSVNGMEVPINYPIDGIFTGIVSPDSTEFFTFDAPPQLGGPGRYRFRIFTLIDGDEDRTNDTLVLSVVNQPIISRFPYMEGFEENDGLWITGRGNRSANSWAHGIPRGERFARAPQGQRAWATNLFGDYFNDEDSYLISPCFDFTGMSEDPYFQAVLGVDTEADFDDLTLEMSTDNGSSWSVVGISPADVNWYNDRPEQVWEGDGGFGFGPVVVANLLEGAAGNVVKLRFRFRSDTDDTAEGILVDAVTISERLMRDVAVVSVDGDFTCPGFEGDVLTVTYQNVGTSVIDTVSISANLATGRFDTLIVDRLAPGNIRRRTFNVPGLYAGASINSAATVTVTADADAELANNSTTLERPFLSTVPFIETFDDGRLPRAFAGTGSVGAGHRNGTLAYVDTLTVPGGGRTQGNLSVKLVGPLREGERLLFDLSLRGQGPEGDVSLTIVQSACDGSAVDTIGEVASAVTSGYAFDVLPETFATNLTIAYSASNGAIVGIDSVRIERCPPNLGVEIDVVPTTSRGSLDAVATVTPTRGVAPYTYQWSTGATTRSVTGLPQGDYQVIVTDALGCSQNVLVAVRNFLDTEDPEGLLSELDVYPNPTYDVVNLALELPRAEEVSLILYDATGRQLRRQAFGRRSSLVGVVDLSQHPAGLYLVRLQAGTAARTVRVVRR